MVLPLVSVYVGAGSIIGLLVAVYVGRTTVGELVPVFDIDAGGQGYLAVSVGMKAPSPPVIQGE